MAASPTRFRVAEHPAYSGGPRHWHDFRPAEPTLIGYYQWLCDDGQWCYRTYTVMPNGALRVEYHAPQYRSEEEDDYSFEAITTTTTIDPGEWREAIPGASFGSYGGVWAIRIADGVMIL